MQMARVAGSWVSISAGTLEGQDTDLSDVATRSGCRHLRDLEGACAENPGTFVLGHIRGGDAVLVGLSSHRGRWVATRGGVYDTICGSVTRIVVMVVSQVVTVVDRLLLLVEAVISRKERFDEQKVSSLRHRTSLAASIDLPCDAGYSRLLSTVLAIRHYVGGTGLKGV